MAWYSPKVAATVEAWPRSLRADYLRIVEMMMEQGPNIGMPHARAMGAGLFEIRAKGREGIGRAFYCAVIGQRIVILHAFVKKTDKTPQRELETARARLKETKA